MSPDILSNSGAFPNNLKADQYARILPFETEPPLLAPRLAYFLLVFIIIEGLPVDLAPSQTTLTPALTTQPPLLRLHLHLETPKEHSSPLTTLASCARR